MSDSVEGLHPGPPDCKSSAFTTNTAPGLKFLPLFYIPDTVFSRLNASGVKFKLGLIVDAFSSLFEPGCY